MENKILIDASSLAAYTGFNRYVDAEEAADKFKKRNPTWCEKNNILVPDEKNPIMETIFHLTDPEKQKLQTDLRTKDSSDATLAIAVQSVGRLSAAAPKNTQSIEIINSNISEPRIRAALESETRKDRGTRLEASSRKRIRDSGVKIETAKVCLTKALSPLENTKVLLVGRLDGSINKNPVELKERRSRLFGSIPVYEKVQLHAYMFLSETTKSTLVESYDGTSQTHNCEFDQVFWEEVMGKLYEFLESIK